MIHFSELELRPGEQAENGARKIVSVGKRTKVNVTLATVSALRPDLVSLFCAAPRLYNELKNLLKNVVREDEEGYASAAEALALADFIPADAPAPRRVQWVVTELADGEMISTRIYDHEETALEHALSMAKSSLPTYDKLGDELVVQLLRKQGCVAATGYVIHLKEVEVRP